jgi:hypothetical protein
MHVTLPDPARAVIERTVAAWNIAPGSAREVARRAPHGHGPARTVRRTRAAKAGASDPVLAHSW